MATIDRHYFRVCTRGAARLKADVPTLLRGAGIDPDDVRQPGWRGDVTAMARLVRSIWEETGDEAMGFTRHGLPRGAFAFAADLARESATVAEGLMRAVRFYNLASRDIVTTLEEDGRGMLVSARFREPALDPEHYFKEFWLIIWHRMACWLSGETVPLLGASFDYGRPHDYLEEFRHLFPCPHVFDAPRCTIVLDRRALALPIRRDAQDLAEMLAVAPLDIMTIPSSDASYTRRVRMLLTDDRAMRVEQVAALLDLAPDALRRRLRREGTSLSQQREQARRDAAVRALRRGNRSVEAISAELGYAEARSFTRAFRTWTGMSPSEFRRVSTDDDAFQGSAGAW